MLVNGFSTKLEATESIFNYDKNILSLKAENNIGNKNLTSETSDVRTKIEALTNTQKMTMSTLIYVVFFVGAVLVVILTLFVITSVQRSIKKFKGTLTQFPSSLACFICKDVLSSSIISASIVSISSPRLPISFVEVSSLKGH